MALLGELPEPRGKVLAIAAVGIEEAEHDRRATVVLEAPLVPFEIGEREGRGLAANREPGEVGLRFGRRLVADLTLDFAARQVRAELQPVVELLLVEHQLAVLLDEHEEQTGKRQNQDPGHDESSDQPGVHILPLLDETTPEILAMRLLAA